MIFALENVEGLGLCLDLGHLSISSLLYGFDFIEAVKKLAETGRVITVHLHNNSSIGTILSEDHNPFWKGNAPIESALKVLKDNDVKRFIIESVIEPAESLRRLYSLIRQV